MDEVKIHGNGIVKGDNVKCAGCGSEIAYPGLPYDKNECLCDNCMEIVRKFQSDEEF